MPVDTKSPVLESMQVRLSYADCDPAGIIYFAAYYPWMERLYNEWTFKGGFPPNRMSELWGASHISRASGCEYFVPTRLFDELTCELRLGDIGNTSLTMACDFVRTEDGMSVAQAYMVFVFIDDDLRPISVPEGMKKVLREAGAVW